MAMIISKNTHRPFGICPHQKESLMTWEAYQWLLPSILPLPSPPISLSPAILLTIRPLSFASCPNCGGHFRFLRCVLSSWINWVMFVITFQRINDLIYTPLIARAGLYNLLVEHYTTIEMTPLYGVHVCTFFTVLWWCSDGNVPSESGEVTQTGCTQTTVPGWWLLCWIYNVRYSFLAHCSVYALCLHLPYIVFYLNII